MGTEVTALGLAHDLGQDLRTGPVRLDLRRVDLAGDLVCFVSMLLFALYLALGRRNRDIPSIWLYVVPLYAIAGLACLVAGAGRLGAVLSFSAKEWLLLLALAVVPTIFGHSLLNGAMKHLDTFLSAARKDGATFTQAFPPECVPIRRGEVVGSLESCVRG